MTEVTMAGGPAPAHARPILVTRELPPPGAYEAIATIKGGEVWYGTKRGIYSKLAQRARELGADAVVGVRAWHQPGGWSWAAPHGEGQAVRVKDRAVLTRMAGDWFDANGNGVAAPELVQARRRQANVRGPRPRGTLPRHRCPEGEGRDHSRGGGEAEGGDPGRARVTPAALWHPWLHVERLTRLVLGRRLTGILQDDRELVAVMVRRREVERAGWFN
jgi:hypothetical protein